MAEQDIIDEFKAKGWDSVRLSCKGVEVGGVTQADLKFHTTEYTITVGMDKWGMDPTLQYLELPSGSGRTLEAARKALLEEIRRLE